MPLMLARGKHAGPEEDSIPSPEPGESAGTFYARILSCPGDGEPIFLPLVVSQGYGVLDARKSLVELLERSERSVTLILEEDQEVLDQQLQQQLDTLLRTQHTRDTLLASCCISEVRTSYRMRSCTEQQDPLAGLVRMQEESFSEMLLRIIGEKGLDPVRVYKRANIDRKHFSKIRNQSSYQPSRQTALALGIALELEYDQLLELIGSAGYTLSHSSVSDLIIEYYITRGNYDIFEINEALFSYDQQLLGR